MGGLLSFIGGAAETGLKGIEAQQAADLKFEQMMAEMSQRMKLQEQMEIGRENRAV